MVDAVLVRECFTEQQLNFGRDVLSLLDEAKIPIAAAYWICTYDRGYWTLEIVTPLADEIGRYKVSSRIHDIVRKAAPPSLAHIESGWLSVLCIKDEKFEKKLRDIMVSFPMKNKMLTRRVVSDDLADLYVYRFPATYAHGTNKQLARPKYAYHW